MDHKISSFSIWDVVFPIARLMLLEHMRTLARLIIIVIRDRFMYRHKLGFRSSRDSAFTSQTDIIRFVCLQSDNLFTFVCVTKGLLWFLSRFPIKFYGVVVLPDKAHARLFWYSQCSSVITGLIRAFRIHSKCTGYSLLARTFIECQRLRLIC